MYYEITAEATVYYSITVKADTLEEALKIAQNNTDSLTGEIDSLKNWQAEEDDDPISPAFNDDDDDEEEEEDQD